MPRSVSVPATIHAMNPSLLLCVGLVAATALVGPVPAQVPPPRATSLPGEAVGASRLPEAKDTRLPGTDPRQCGTSIRAALCSYGRWANFSTIEVTLKAPEFEGAYTMERPINGEAHSTYREQWSQGRRGGEIIFVSDDSFAYRSREPFPDSDTILDEMMAAPSMVAQLTAVLLDQAARVGPAEVTDKAMTLSAKNDTQFVRTETPTTASLYGPPWQVTGTMRASAPKMMKFSLRFTFRPVDPDGRVSPTRSETLELSGTANYTDRRPKMPDSFDLVGWKLVKAGTTMQAVQSLAEARQAVGTP